MLPMSVLGKLQSCMTIYQPWTQVKQEQLMDKRQMDNWYVKNLVYDK